MLTAVIIAALLLCVVIGAGLNLAPYIPPTDTALDLWAQNFDTKITATPTAYGLTSGQATAFHTLRADYTSKLLIANTPATRTKSTVAAKNTAKQAMVFDARSLAALVQAFPTITPTQLEDLGLTVRKVTPTPIGPPTTKPIITPLSSTGANVMFRFSDETTPDSRSRPFGTIGMEMFVKVGTTPPAGISDCDFLGIYTKNTSGPGSRECVAPFSGGDVGKTAYFLARWFNKRGEPGPVSGLAQHTIAA